MITEIATITTVVVVGPVCLGSSCKARIRNRGRTLWRSSAIVSVSIISTITIALAFFLSESFKSFIQNRWWTLIFAETAVAITIRTVISLLLGAKKGMAKYDQNTQKM